MREKKRERERVCVWCVGVCVRLSHSLNISSPCLFLQDLTKGAYMKSTAPSINHFYEKLLRLKDMMKTEAGRRIAAER